MSLPAPTPAAEPRVPYSGRKRSARNSLVAQGEPMVWLTGGALVLAIAMIAGLLLLIVANGVTTFWPVALVEVHTLDGQRYLGEPTRHERFRPPPELFESLAEPLRQRAEQESQAHGGTLGRQLLRTGNFDVTQETHFHWVDDFRVADDGRTLPEWGLVIERLAWGRFYGFPVAFRLDGQPVADTPAEVWQRFNEYHAASRDRWRQRRELEAHALGTLNAQLEQARLRVRRVERRNDRGSPQWSAALAAANENFAEVERQTAELSVRIGQQIGDLRDENQRYRLVMRTVDGVEREIMLEDIVRAYPANQLTLAEKLGLYLARWVEFLTDDPREANSEGGVYPAIFGTVVMTLIMSLAVLPFGVLAALYLREYAKGGWIVSIVRISINNLAGVPSIVFGVFGLGFFCYGVGGWVDGGPKAPWTSQAWLTGLAVWVLLLVVALASAAVMTAATGLTHRLTGRLVWYLSLVAWLGALVLGVLLVAKSPFFEGFFPERLPSPTFGKGALIWASLTLALLTLPVVIVATEEALAAVPNSMREGSYACGASKWQTIRRIVLPRALPGIMTGMILAMARGAGEVAPLMLVGAVKLAHELPIDGRFPFIHPERSFMHLGFHIYDLGFQSQNSEAARPMVYTTTLLLILIVAVLNLAAIWARTLLRRRFAASQF